MGVGAEGRSCKPSKAGHVVEDVLALVVAVEEEACLGQPWP